MAINKPPYGCAHQEAPFGAACARAYRNDRVLRILSQWNFRNGGYLGRRRRPDEGSPELHMFGEQATDLAPYMPTLRLRALYHDRNILKLSRQSSIIF